MVVKVPMLAFVITVYQVSAYAVALFRRAMLLLHFAYLQLGALRECPGAGFGAIL